jgi:hypothetical protein
MLESKAFFKLAIFLCVEKIPRNISKDLTHKSQQGYSKNPCIQL